MEDIKTVYSHPQSLMQSARFLSEHDWKQISMQNNAFAAQKVVKDGDKTQAAIASAYAGEIYGLDVLKKGVNQSDTNSTRFIIVTNQKVFLKIIQEQFIWKLWEIPTAIFRILMQLQLLLINMVYHWLLTILLEHLI